MIIFRASPWVQLQFSYGANPSVSQALTFSLCHPDLGAPRRPGGVRKCIWTMERGGIEEHVHVAYFPL